MKRPHFITTIFNKVSHIDKTDLAARALVDSVGAIAGVMVLAATGMTALPLAVGIGAAAVGAATTHINVFGLGKLEKVFKRGKKNALQP